MVDVEPAYLELSLDEAKGHAKHHGPEANKSNFQICGHYFRQLLLVCGMGIDHWKAIQRVVMHVV